MKKRIVAVLAAALIAVFAVGCNVDKTPEGWADTIERPDISAPAVVGSYVKYPEAPESAPGAPDTGKAPSVTGYAANREATEENGGYTVGTTEIDEKEYPQFTYDDLQDYDYVYAKVDNYHSEYGNIIITVNSPSAEKIAVQAIYYEMYTESNRAVTVYSGDLGGATDRRIIARLDRYVRLDSEWRGMGADNNLENAKIIGFALFIDSSPTQTASDRKGSLTVKSFEFVKDDDPGLEVQYVVPSANFDGTFSSASSGYEIEKLYTDTENPKFVTGIDVSYDGVARYSQLYVPIMDKDSIPDYAEFSVKISTENVGTYSIGVMFSPGGNSWYPYVNLVTVKDAEDGEHEHTVNFDGVNPGMNVAPWNSVSGEFITDHGVYQIVFWFDSLDGADINNSAKATVSDIAFNRTATDGARVGKTWSSTVPQGTIGDDVDFGGVGTFEYAWYSTWYYLTMPVSGYKVEAPKSKMTIKFTSEDDIDRFGVALISSNVRTNNGEAVICSTWEGFAETTSGAAGQDSAAYGTTYTVVKDGNTWTLTFDFSKAKTLEDGNPFWKARISGVRIYLNDPESKTPAWSGTHTIHFDSVEFAD